jgi:hypothetical protein
MACFPKLKKFCHLILTYYPGPCNMSTHELPDKPKRSSSEDKSMAFNLASIRPTSARVALKMVVGGPNKIGKTTLAL